METTQCVCTGLVDRKTVSGDGPRRGTAEAWSFFSRLEYTLIKRHIFCVDENPLLREGIAYAIDRQPDLLTIAEASSGEEALALYPLLKPDLTLMDLKLPGLNGISTIRAIRSKYPHSRFVLLTTYPNDLDAQHAFAASAEGYLEKHLLRTNLLSTIRIVLDGGRVLPFAIAAELSSLMGVRILTEREIQILKLLETTQSTLFIANTLCISEELVAAHLKNILKKLHAQDAEHALTIARNRGHLEPPRR